MDWTRHADGEIDGAVQRLRDDQRAQVQQSEDAHLVELRANAVAASAHAVIEICQQRIAEDAEEIARLQAEQPVTTTRGAADGGR